jgi:hypothetical protein
MIEVEGTICAFDFSKKYDLSLLPTFVYLIAGDAHLCHWTFLLDLNSNLRKYVPYARNLHESKDQVTANLRRVVETWMDQEHKGCCNHYFYFKRRDVASCM